MKWLFPTVQPPSVPLAGPCPCLQLPQFSHNQELTSLGGSEYVPAQIPVRIQEPSNPGLGVGSVPLSIPHSLASPAEKGMQFFKKKNEKLFSPLSGTEAFLRAGIVSPG